MLLWRTVTNARKEAGYLVALQVGRTNIVADGFWGDDVASVVCQPDLGFIQPMLEGTPESVASGSWLELPLDVPLVPVSIWRSGLTRRVHIPRFNSQTMLSPSTLRYTS